MSRLQQLHRHGQAIWFDYIRRSFLTSGELQRLVNDGVRGVTSNPAIFEKAIAGSADYDTDLQGLVEQGKSVDEIYEALAMEDIRMAAAVLRPVFDSSRGEDGYVSLEVSPTLAHDTAGTVEEAKRLFAELDLPNVMIKVPATAAGIPAIRTLIGSGINVNVTLIFSLAHYEAVVEAYLAGLEDLLQAGGNPRSVASVASFFVSRVDTALDPLLEEREEAELLGKIANDNAKLAYARFEELFAGPRWEQLATAGARVQRPLWASTGTKNPQYPDTLYVDNLIGPHTVNTLPPATLQAFVEHGTVATTVCDDVAGSRARVQRLAQLGISLDAVTQQLQDEGVAAFAKAFEVLMASITEKRNELLANWQAMNAALGAYQPAVDRALAELRDGQVMQRIWDHDHTVWKPQPDEISNRLGWLRSAEVMQEHVGELQDFATAARAAGYDRAVLLGMGGSSLAPEVLRKTFGVADGHLDLSVLDSTQPDAVLSAVDSLALEKTLFLVATKSGGTVETLSLFKYCYRRVVDRLGAERAGEHFAAITDPGSSLAELAEKLGFRRTFLNDPNIGGRFSALSYFGLVPAALLGIDVAELLERALRAADNCESCNCPLQGDNHGAQLGVILAELAKAGRDKLTLLLPANIAGFGDWAEQLVAESLGKDGVGILPVVGETPAATYTADRVFVHFDGADADAAAQLQRLEQAGHPVIRLQLRDPYDLGYQFFLWEMATAVAGARLGVNPFDQPNVESAKVAAREMVAAYRKTGSLPPQQPALNDAGLAVYTDLTADTLAAALTGFLQTAPQGGYVAIQAYLEPNTGATQALARLQSAIRDRTGLATTVGIGPRFLHSTGQLHKGDGGQGLFLQLTADPARDADIPDAPEAATGSMSFGVLVQAQAMGDRQALLDAGRRVIRFHLGHDPVAGIESLLRAL